MLLRLRPIQEQYLLPSDNHDLFRILSLDLSRIASASEAVERTLPLLHNLQVPAEAVLVWLFFAWLSIAKIAGKRLGDVHH